LTVTAPLPKFSGEMVIDDISWGSKIGVARPVHPDKDIEAAVSFAEARGWRYVPSSGHAWGRLFCPGGQRGDCKISVWSTPR